MTIDQVRQACRASPFQPFRIRMTDGRQFGVPNTEGIALDPRGRTVVVFDERGVTAILDVALMAALEGIDAGGAQAAG